MQNSILQHFVWNVAYFTERARFNRKTFPKLARFISRIRMQHVCRSRLRVAREHFLPRKTTFEDLGRNCAKGDELRRRRRRGFRSRRFRPRVVRAWRGARSRLRPGRDAWRARKRAWIAWALPNSPTSADAFSTPPDGGRGGAIWSRWRRHASVEPELGRPRAVQANRRRARCAGEGRAHVERRPPTR